MKTVTTTRGPPLLFALLMSQPPRQSPQPPLSASPTPPSSLPPSPNPLPSSKNNSKVFAVSLSDALLQPLSDDDDCDDDGVDVVMQMLDNEKPVCAPMPTPDVDRLLAGWKSADWGHSKSAGPSVKDTPILDTTPKCVSDVGSEGSTHEDEDWLYSEDCIVADVFTSVGPERQRDELRKRLPKRRWSEAYRRFRSVCGEACDEQRNADDRDDRRRRKGLWRRPGGNMKPRCFIAKTLSKFR